MKAGYLSDDCFKVKGREGSYLGDIRKIEFWQVVTIGDRELSLRYGYQCGIVLTNKSNQFTHPNNRLGKYTRRSENIMVAYNYYCQEHEVPQEHRYTNTVTTCSYDI